TKEMEQKIEEEMEKIEKYGGIVKAVADGFIQRLVARQAFEIEGGLESGELLKVGVNIYREGESMDVELHEYNWESAEKQIESLREVRRERSDKDVSRTLKDLESATRDGKNVMPYLVACCKAYATVGEMVGIFREIFGEFNEPSLF
ncbi:MAG: methylmalonyl-CoA mutase family protein, partial [Syntrophorhabdaceae bacterium]|nr:methylmalonyl-CoA mutase family protein [Syntrophorhabdaceae bacterium]